ncbi:MAG TPA: thermonuclease family protein [Micropepsaceae bacterium]|jgi:endonuclease YncB( thermonuclease family)|nr:thermonuclease family protein [Micropepsaceae bacterium]
MAEHHAWVLPGLAAALLLLATAADKGAPARFAAAEALEGPVAGVVQRVVDGDTIEVRAAIWLGQTITIRVRIDGVDAPELEARCPEERRLALAARDFLVHRLEGAPVKLSAVVYDKYGGRVRASVADGKGDVANALLASGLVRPHHGERRQSWCDAA